MSTKPKNVEEGDFKVIKYYWALYGGFGALIKSAYFHMAIAISAIGYKFWYFPEWWEMPFSIIPSMLGFSLAGYAIFLAFGNDEFRSFLVKAKIRDSSAFVSLTATFMHFVLLQVLSLLLSFVAKFLFSITVTLPSLLADGLFFLQKLFWFFCFVLFIYSITTSLASVIAIFRIVRLFDTYIKIVERRKSDAAENGNDE